MEPFTTYTGRIVVITGDNIDTDRIIPARFLTRVSRQGYGELLFKDVRGPEFILDMPEAVGSSIMVVGTNFGCGSSREHAVWAIQQAGYKAVFARKTDNLPGFSDIFRQNSANCGLLLGELEPADHAELVAAGTASIVDIDLPNQTIRTESKLLKFQVNEATKQALIEGLDLIGTTLIYTDRIAEYEAKNSSFIPA